MILYMTNIEKKMIRKTHLSYRQKIQSAIQNILKSKNSKLDDSLLNNLKEEGRK